VHCDSEEPTSKRAKLISESDNRQTMISNLPTLAVVTLSTGGNPKLECNASPFKSERKTQNSKSTPIPIIKNPNSKLTNRKKEKMIFRIDLDLKAEQCDPAT